MDLEKLIAAIAEMERLGKQRLVADQPLDPKLMTLHSDYVMAMAEVVIEAKRLVARENERRVGFDIKAEHV